LPSAVCSTASVLTLFLACFLSACAARSPSIPTIRDEKLQLFVAAEALRILGVSENARKAALYKFHLVNFPRRDILGLNIGNQQIFINYELTRLAYEKESYRWLFRQTLAHEIAHDVLSPQQESQKQLFRPGLGLANSVTGQELGLTGNGAFRSYSRTSELAADRKGMEYWRKLGWECGIWVRIFRDFLDQGYAGDVDHPTQERLSQAIQLCRQTPSAQSVSN